MKSCNSACFKINWLLPLLKTWAVISWEAIFVLFLVCSVDLDILYMYIVAGHCPTMSNFIVLCLCLRFPPGWFVLNLMVSTPCSDDFFWTDSWQAIEKLWYLFHVLVQVEYPHRYLYLQIDYLIAQSRETARLPGRTIIPLQHLGNCGHLSYNNVKTSSLAHPETEHKV